VNTGEFLALTLSGVIVNVAGIILTTWLSHRSLKRHLDTRTIQQTGDIRQLTDAQTGDIRQLTDAQTARLLKRRWWQRRA
jgi:hypothetical protein